MRHFAVETYATEEAGMEWRTIERATCAECGAGYTADVDYRTDEWGPLRSDTGPDGRNYCPACLQRAERR
jgi:hypothetical protein